MYQGTAIRDRIQEKLMRQESKELLEKGQNGQREDTEEQFYEEYFEHDIVDSCEDNEDDEEEYYDEIEEQCSSASKALKSNQIEEQKIYVVLVPYCSLLLQ